MTHAFRCPVTGLVEFADVSGWQRCPYCGEEHTTYAVGVPPQTKGFPNTGNPFKPHWSPPHGKRLNSWSDYHTANKEMNLVDIGQKPPPKSEQYWGAKKAYSYKGQKRAE